MPLCGHEFEIDPLFQIDFEPAIGVDVEVDERGKAAIVFGGQTRDHVGVAPDGLHHPRVHVDQR